MGGDLFSKHHPLSHPSSPTLHTPRLDPETYTHLKAQYTSLLKQFFPTATRIDTLREAPSKPSYGDIDIFLAFATPPSIPWKDVAAHLGARALVIRGAGKISLGIPLSGPWEGGGVEVFVPDPPKGAGQKGVSGEAYVQVDVQVILEEEVEWFWFYSSFGDLAVMLGHIVHWLGFTVRDTGFDLRLREADEVGLGGVSLSGEEGRVRLSRDPGMVMRFSGLDVEVWKEGFETMEELYVWLEKCRLIRYGAWRMKRDNNKSRRRATSRTAFTGFFRDWLPQRLPENENRDIEIGVEKEETKAYLQSLKHARGLLTRDAVEFFDQQTEYQTKQTKLAQRFGTAYVGTMIKEVLATDSAAEVSTTSQAKKLKEYVRAFRRFTGVAVKDGKTLLYMRDKPTTDDESELFRLVSPDGTSIHSRPALEAFLKTERETVKDLLRKQASGGGQP